MSALAENRLLAFSLNAEALAQMLRLQAAAQVSQ